MNKPILEVGDLMWVFECPVYTVIRVLTDKGFYQIRSNDDFLIHEIPIDTTDDYLRDGDYGYKKMKKINDFKKAIGSL